MGGEEHFLAGLKSAGRGKGENTRRNDLFILIVQFCSVFLMLLLSLDKHWWQVDL